ncbi:hypothetical protein, partial [Wohlfahrtiimonas chitiniclastica]|uniref:hypothetical protein n=1 Tax=Wohlfahrtiimonas chitiniclastica TaxID=400946 RepID=UPI001BD02A2C
LLYDFLKDHGSLIAGIIGFIGIFILVWNQSKTTERLVESNKVLMKSEALEIQKTKAIESASRIGSKLEHISLPAAGFSCAHSNFGVIFFDDISVDLYFLDTFLQNNDPLFESGMVHCKACIDDFVSLYKSSYTYGGVISNQYCQSLLNSLLCSLINLYSSNKVASCKGRNVVYTDWNGAELISSPLQLHDEFNTFNEVDIYGYLTLQMTGVVMPTFIYEINKLSIK